MRGRVDGLILMAPDFDPSPFLRESVSTVPTVLLNPGHAPSGLDSVSIDNFDGAASAVRHLIGLGHRSIAIIAGPASNIDARQRLEGYRAALREAGLEPRPELELPGDFAEHSGYQAAAELLRRPTRPSAIFAANDYMAVGALGALHDAGVRVPEDIALSGFDDIALARYLNPPLTTVHVDMIELGRRAVQLLLERGAHPGGRTGRHEVLTTTLVVRRSCGAEPRAAGESRGPRNGGSPMPPPRR
jgi:LacI family transcriptional regulator